MTVLTLFKYLLLPIKEGFISFIHDSFNGLLFLSIFGLWSCTHLTVSCYFLPHGHTLLAFWLVIQLATDLLKLLGCNLNFFFFLKSARDKKEDVWSMGSLVSSHQKCFWSEFRLSLVCNEKRSASIWPSVKNHTLFLSMFNDHRMLNILKYSKM